MSGARTNPAVKIFAAVAIASSAACSLPQPQAWVPPLVGTVASTVEMFGRQIEEQRSFFSTSTAIFYPSGPPERMAILPPLSTEQLKSIQSDLDRQARILAQTLTEHRAMISSALGLEIVDVTKQRFEVRNVDAATAKLLPDGTIVVDAKVIQGIYRGILLSVLNPQSSGQPADAGSASERRQIDALTALIEAREMFLSASPVPSITLARQAVDSMVKKGMTIDAASELIDRQLELAGATLISEKASKSYDDALSFLIAHEIGHRAMNHYGRLAAGAPPRALELEADRFGALLVLLARNRQIHPNWGYPFPPPNQATVRWFGGPYCLTEINYEPAGHVSFFEYGYALAGLDSLGATSASHPERSERLAATRRLSLAAHWSIVSAQNSAGNCFGTKGQEKVARDPGAAFDEESASRERRLQQLESQSGGSDQSDIETRNLLRDLLTERSLAHVVFVDFFRRLYKQEPEQRW